MDLMNRVQTKGEPVSGFACFNDQVFEVEDAERCSVARTAEAQLRAQVPGCGRFSMGGGGAQEARLGHGTTASKWSQVVAGLRSTSA
jgi:ribosomal protein L4